MYLVLAWRNIWRNRRRTFITMASVFFAVLLAIIMRSATKGVYENMTDTMVRFSSGYIQVHAKGYWDERVIDNSFSNNQSLWNRIQQTGASSIVPRLETFALIAVGEKSRPVAIIGMDPSRESGITNIGDKIIQGTLPKNSEKGIVLGVTLAKILHAQVGDSVVLLGQGYHGNMAAGLLPVCGIVRLGSPKLDESMAYMDLSACQHVFSADSMITSLSVMVSKPDAMEGAYQAIRATIDTNKYEVMHWKQMLPELDQLVEADSAGHYITIYILYLVISFGLFGTMLMMTRERLHEFGILVAIGMHKRVLGLIVVIELFLISAIGVLVASAVGYPIVNWFHQHPIRVGGRVAEVYKGFGLDAIIPCSNDPTVIAYQALIVMLVTMLLASYPFLKIQRLQPLQAINS
ncbi:MAG: ABC transporter permease [Arcticibacter sp.]